MNDEVGVQRGRSESRLSILVVDESEPIRRLLAEGLHSSGYDVVTAENGNATMRAMATRTVDLVLLDLTIPGHDSLETLRMIKRWNRSVTVVVMAGCETVGSVVQSIRLGAEDLLGKPLSIPSVKELVKRIDAERRRAAGGQAATEPGTPEGSHRLTGFDPSMNHIEKLIDRVAPLPSTVLIEGESGTGKELVAREIHARSPRAQRPFIAFNCAAVPAQLLESELFGYERGAFTGAVARKEGYFEAADGGTLFIDEISEICPDLQTKLLRVIQERKFRRVGGIEEIATDVRIIAATNRDLEYQVARRRFREDLYYRINVVNIEVPPLRERPGDIRLLSEHFVERFSHAFGKEVVGFDRDVVELFLRYQWPGNVRELQNIVESAVVMTNAQRISLSDLSQDLLRKDQLARTNRSLKPYQTAKEEFETDYLVRALRESGGNIAMTARRTGITRQRLYDKLARHHIEQTVFRHRDEPGDVA